MKINTWARDAYPGDVYTYHVGQSLDDGAGGKVPEARAAWLLAVAGEVTLFQRRLTYGRFAYEAMRLPRVMGQRLAPTEY